MTTTTPRTEGSIGIEALARLEAAWNAGDGTAFGEEYTADASFVTIRGERIVGGPAIGAGHAGILSTIYRGSVNSMALVEARRLADDVLLVVSRNTLDCPAGPLAGVHHALSTSLLTHDADRRRPWMVAATHNTIVAA